MSDSRGSSLISARGWRAWRRAERRALAAEASLLRAKKALRDLAEADGITKPTWANPWLRARDVLEELDG